MISRPSIFHNIVLRDLFVYGNKKMLVNVVSELDLLFSHRPYQSSLGDLFFFFFKWLDDLLLLVTYSRRYLGNPSP